MEERELKDFLEQSNGLLEESPQMDEQNTRRKIIEPFLELLGWNILSSEVELEYSVKIGTTTTKVDYALLVDDTPVVLVEAKGVDTSLSESDRQQLGSYIRQTGVDFGLLTNGREYKIIKRKTESNRPEEVLLGSFTLENLPENAYYIQTLSREKIETGDAGDIAEQIQQDQRTAKKLREQKTELADRITNIITSEIGESATQTVENGAKQFLDVLAKSMEQQAEGQLPIEPDTSTAGSTETVSEWTPLKGANAIVGTIPRQNIGGSPDDLVALFPTKRSGVQFLKENNAWGFVKLGREPKYVTMYVSEDVQQIKYIAKVQDIVNADQAEYARSLDAYSESQSSEEQAGFDTDKQVITFEPGTLYEFEDPIELGSKWPQGLTYTTLEDIKSAEKTHEAF
jgi:hypothetical protein